MTHTLVALALGLALVAPVGLGGCESLQKASEQIFGVEPSPAQQLADLAARRNALQSEINMKTATRTIPVQAGRALTDLLLQANNFIVGGRFVLSGGDEAGARKAIASGAAILDDVEQALEAAK